MHHFIGGIVMKASVILAGKSITRNVLPSHALRTTGLSALSRLSLKALALIPLIALSGAAQALPVVSFYNSYVGVAGSELYYMTTAPSVVSVPGGEAGGTGSITSTLGSDPSVSFAYDNVAFVGGLAGGSAQVDMTYYVEWVDPTAPVNSSINVAVHATDMLAQAGAGTAMDELLVTNGITDVVETHCVTGAGDAGCGGGGSVLTSGAAFSTKTFSMLVNSVYSVELTVSGYGGFTCTNEPSCTQGVAGSASGSIDPFFTTTATGGQFEFSPGVSATPLPSTWVMLLGGFVGLGFFAYRGSMKDSSALAAA
jgi:hypothetical protein